MPLRVARGQLGTSAGYLVAYRFLVIRRASVRIFTPDLSEQPRMNEPVGPHVRASGRRLDSPPPVRPNNNAPATERALTRGAPESVVEQLVEVFRPVPLLAGLAAATAPPDVLRELEIGRAHV